MTVETPPKVKRVAKPRCDLGALAPAGQINEKTAAKMLDRTPTTLAAWRRQGFARQPFAPKWFKPHPRLVAYVLADIERLVALLTNTGGPDHPAVSGC